MFEELFGDIVTWPEKSDIGWEDPTKFQLASPARFQGEHENDIL